MTNHITLHDALAVLCQEHGHEAIYDEMAFIAEIDIEVQAEYAYTETELNIAAQRTVENAGLTGASIQNGGVS